MKITVIFLLILSISSCNVVRENLEIYKDNYEKKSTSNSATFLTANFFFSRGDAYTASKILNKKVENIELLQLKFFSNLISGNFEEANKTSILLASDSKQHNLYHLPKYVLNIKRNNFNQNLQFLKNSDINISLNNLTPLIKLWILESQNKIDTKVYKGHQEGSIYKLLILENFYKPESLKKIAYKIYASKELNSNDTLLLAGFFFRLNDFEKFNNIIQTKLSNQFDKQFIIKNFSFHNNIFYKKTNLNTILASKIYNNSILNNKQNENSYSYQKILLEISLFLCPKLDIAKYSLAELYYLEKTHYIALEKLKSISSFSFFDLPGNLKKLSIIKSLNKKNSYKNLLFKFNEKWPNNKFLLYRLADYYKSNKQYDKSIKIYQKIINIYGNNDRDLFLYASNLDKVGKWKEAKILFLKLLKRNPKDTYTLNYVSYKLALKNQDLDFALSLIKKALDLDPNNAFFLDTIGWIEFKRTNYNEAVFYLEKSVAILPKSSEILDHLGDCYLMLGRKVEAIFEWKKAIKYEKDKYVIRNIREKLIKYE